MPESPDQDSQAFLLRQTPDGDEPHRVEGAFSPGVSDRFQHAPAHTGGNHVSRYLMGGGPFHQLLHEGAGDGPGIDLACDVGEGGPIHPGSQSTRLLGPGNQPRPAGSPSSGLGEQRVDEELVQPGAKDRGLDGLVCARDIGMEGVEMWYALKPGDPGSEDQRPSLGLGMDYVETGTLRDELGSPL